MQTAGLAQLRMALLWNLDCSHVGIHSDTPAQEVMQDGIPHLNCVFWYSCVSIMPYASIIHLLKCPCYTQNYASIHQ